MQLICIPEAAALLSTRDKSPALKMCRVCISRLDVYWWHKPALSGGGLWFVSCLHLCVVLFCLLLLFCLIFTAFYFLSLSRVRH